MTAILAVAPAADDEVEILSPPCQAVCAIGIQGDLIGCLQP